MTKFQLLGGLTAQTKKIAPTWGRTPDLLPTSHPSYQLSQKFMFSKIAEKKRLTQNFM